MVNVHLTIVKLSKCLNMIVSFHIPTSGIGEISSLHTLANTWYD